MEAKSRRTIRNYRDLKAWEHAMLLAQAIYRLTKHFPPEGLYGMTSQMRRAAVSIPSNIAEGFARRTPKDTVRFLRIAQGSLDELETQIILAQRLGFLNQETAFEIWNQSQSTTRLLNGLVRAIKPP